MTRGKASVGHTRRCTYGSPIPTRQRNAEYIRPLTAVRELILRSALQRDAAAVPYDHGTADEDVSAGFDLGRVTCCSASHAAMGISTVRRRYRTITGPRRGRTRRTAGEWAPSSEDMDRR